MVSFRLVVISRVLITSGSLILLEGAIDRVPFGTILKSY